MAVGALRLDLGDLDLVSADGGYSTYSLHALGEGVDFGEPQPIDVTLASLMVDGSPTETTRHDNRTIVFRVEVVSPDGQGLADGEAALVAFEGARTTLAWTPSDGYGPTSVFRVETVHVKFLFNDFDEIRTVKRRTFQVTLTCLPFARSATTTTVGAEFVAAATVISDDCEATTGWSASAIFPATQDPIAVAVDSSVFATGTGALRFTPAGSASTTYGVATARFRVTRTGLSINAAGGGYFVLRVRPEWTLSTGIMDAYLTTSAGGRQSVSVLVGEADASGFLRLSFAVPDTSTITAFDFVAAQSVETLSVLPAPKVWVDSLGLAGNSSANQNVMAFDVAGSMRCEGSFQVSAPAGLGDVLLYTVPDLGDGFRPDLRRLMATGATTADTAAINGSRVALTASGTPPTFSAPASMFRPGSYAVLARVKRIVSNPTTLTLTAQTKSGASGIGPLSTVASPSFSLADTDYHLMRVGVIELPPLVVDRASNATVLFTFSCAGSTDYHLDELLVFPLEDHALTWVSCGTGAASATVASRLWVDEPSPSRPRGARLIGNDVGRLDARYALPLSAGRHVLKPGRMLAYLLTSAAGGADLQATYTAAWHSNAGA